MKILAIDQSFANCAYVVLEDKNMITFGIIRACKEDDAFTKSLHVANELYRQYMDYNIDNVKIEGLAFGMRGNSTRDLAGLLFTIINLFVDRDSGFVYEILAPTSVKKFATGSGKAQKSDMICALPDNIKKRFVDSGYKKTTGLSDLADAYWIGMLGYDNDISNYNTQR